MLGKLLHYFEQGARRRAWLRRRQRGSQLSHDLVPDGDLHDRAPILLDLAHELGEALARFGDGHACHLLFSVRTRRVGEGVLDRSMYISVHSGPYFCVTPAVTASVHNPRHQEAFRGGKQVVRAMRRSDAIAQLQADARIYGRCPVCEKDFPLGRALLFYAGALPPEAARTRVEARREDLQARAIALRERRRRASEGAMQKAIDVNVGMILERVAPVCDGFGSAPRDCRPLFDPIDYVVFNGLSLHGEVKSITFVDVKTGAGALTPRQRHIRAAIECGKVEWQEYSIEARP